MVNFLLKNMKFCTLVVHDLINYISYDAKLNRSKNCYFGGKTVKILWKNRKKLENICVFHICWYIGLKSCTVVVHILNKDISYDSKLNESKNLSFWSEKEGDLTQSYDKTPIPTENSKTKGQHTNATKNFDYTTIADRLRTVSWSNKSSNWCG